MMLWFPLADAARASLAQRFAVKMVSAPSPVLVTATTAKRAVVERGAPVFLGGAWAHGLAEMALNPNAWRDAAKATGYCEGLPGRERLRCLPSAAAPPLWLPGGGEL